MIIVFGTPVTRSRPFHLHGPAVFHRIRGSDLNFDLFCGPLSDEQVIASLDVVEDGLIHLVPANPNGFAVDDSRQRDHGDLRGSASNIQNHISGGFLDGEANTDRGGHRFFNEKDFPGAGGFGGIAYCTPLHLGDTRRHTDDDSWPDQRLSVVNLRDEVAKHGLRDFEIGDHTIFHRPDSLDRPRGPAHHAFGFRPHRQYLLRVPMNGHHGRFCEHHSFSPDVDQCIGSAQVNG